jgi:ketosteroid isomerase-like protein
MADRKQIARDSYAAFAAGDRDFFERHLADEVVVTYELRRPDGTGGRNTEVLTFDGEQIKRIEVYFGWDQ